MNARQIRSIQSNGLALARADVNYEDPTRPSYCKCSSHSLHNMHDAANNPYEPCICTGHLPPSTFPILSKLNTLGANFRPCPAVNEYINRDELLCALHNPFARTLKELCDDVGQPYDSCLPFVNAVYDDIDSWATINATNIKERQDAIRAEYLQRDIPLFDDDAFGELQRLQDSIIITGMDKVRNNSVFICKELYVQLCLGYINTTNDDGSRRYPLSAIEPGDHLQATLVECVKLRMPIGPLGYKPVLDASGQPTFSDKDNVTLIPPFRADIKFHNAKHSPRFLNCCHNSITATLSETHCRIMTYLTSPMREIYGDAFAEATRYHRVQFPHCA